VGSPPPSCTSYLHDPPESAEEVTFSFAFVYAAFCKEIHRMKKGKWLFTETGVTI